MTTKFEKILHCKISKLEEPKRIFRNNFESQIQDLPVLSKETFVQKFPNDYFDKERKKLKKLFLSFRTKRTRK
jgi:hypothetical protein